MRRFTTILTGLILALYLASSVSAYNWNKAVYKCIPNQENKIALTFDDGPHPRLTREILKVLDEYNVKATFFMIGENADYYPDVVEETAKKGHEIANHTYNHYGNSYSISKNEILRTEEALIEKTDQRTKFLRPPSGSCSEGFINLARSLDYTVVLWSVDTKDWTHRPAEKIAEYVLDNVKSGDIILMHDYICGNSPTAEALKAMIPELISSGFEFVTVSELIYSK